MYVIFSKIINDGQMCGSDKCTMTHNSHIFTRITANMEDELETQLYDLSVRNTPYNLNVVICTVQYKYFKTWPKIENTAECNLKSNHCHFLVIFVYDRFF